MLRFGRLFSLAPLLLIASCGGSLATGEAPPAPPPAPSVAQAEAEAPPPAAPPIAADSDEGMWLLNNFPSETVAKKYGFGPTQAWLDDVRLSSVRLAFGCSGSIVSPSGLVMTNHHCASDCIQKLSTAKKDLIKNGYFAKGEKDEAKCPDMEVNQLVAITDVTSRVEKATEGQRDSAYIDARKAAFSAIEKECAAGDDVRCDVVTLYHGGQYHLYKYRRYQDIRLVFAPEMAIAFFGGDPDNFNFPRYDLDVSFLRIYDGDKPAKTDNHFKWSTAGVKEGDLTFVSGHPASTSRQDTVAQLEFERDVRLPEYLLRYSEARGVLTAYGMQGEEQRRTSSKLLFRIENGIKALRGRHAALLDKDFFGSKVAAEKDLRDRVARDPALSESAGAWDAIAAAERVERDVYSSYVLIEKGAGLWSTLFDIARTLVRAADELPKESGKRLREFGDSQLPQLKLKLFSEAPLYDEVEALTLGMGLVKLRETLGPDDAFVKKVIGSEEPRALAKALIKGTKLKDPKVRKALFEGGKAAIEASTDPLIKLALLVDPDAREVRKTHEDKVEAVIDKSSELIAKARFAAYGTSVYPDATFTLRLSYGSVKGWTEAGKPVNPVTTIGGAFDRATGKDPFALPKSWLDAKSRLNLATPFNFSSTNDIIGGNSGSPVIDKDAKIVGLIFDGNIHSLGGAYGFDPVKNRAVSVHSAAILEALDKVYGAGRILSELDR